MRRSNLKNCLIILFLFSTNVFAGQTVVCGISEDDLNSKLKKLEASESKKIEVSQPSASIAMAMEVISYSSGMSSDYRPIVKQLICVTVKF